MYDHCLTPRTPCGDIIVTIRFEGESCIACVLQTVQATLTPCSDMTSGGCKCLLDRYSNYIKVWSMGEIVHIKSFVITLKTRYLWKSQIFIHVKHSTIMHWFTVDFYIRKSSSLYAKRVRKSQGLRRRCRESPIVNYKAKLNYTCVFGFWFETVTYMNNLCMSDKSSDRQDPDVRELDSRALSGTLNFPLMWYSLGTSDQCWGTQNPFPFSLFCVSCVLSSFGVWIGSFNIFSLVSLCLNFTFLQKCH